MKKTCIQTLTNHWRNETNLRGARHARREVSPCKTQRMPTLKRFFRSLTIVKSPSTKHPLVANATRFSKLLSARDMFLLCAVLIYISNLKNPLFKGSGVFQLGEATHESSITIIVDSQI